MKVLTPPNMWVITTNNEGCGFPWGWFEKRFVVIFTPNLEIFMIQIDFRIWGVPKMVVPNNRRFFLLKMIILWGFGGTTI